MAKMNGEKKMEKIQNKFEKKKKSPNKVEKKNLAVN